jgi:hypothetical protein
VITGPSTDRAYGRDLVVSQTDPSILYLCGCENGVGKIWVSFDAGLTWFDGTGDLGTYLDPNAYYSDVRKIWMSPTDPDRLVVGCYGVYGPENNFVSTNAGTTWTPIPAMSDNLYHYAYDFAYHPGLDTLYMAAYYGNVQKSEDQGLTWEDMNDGYPGAYTYCVDVDIRNGYLYAGTYANSLCRLDIPPAGLWTAYDEVSAAVGGTVTLELNAPERAWHTYMVAGTKSGTIPGTNVGYTHVPLNKDSITQFVYDNLNTAMFTNFQGTLDGSGKATATLNVPMAVPLLPGTVLNFAFITFSPIDYSSNAIDVVILP